MTTRFDELLPNLLAQLLIYNSEIFNFVFLTKKKTSPGDRAV